jgi:hypothetical protein
MTFCCSVVWRLPCCCALVRSRWAESSTSFDEARKASPRFCVQSGWSPIIWITCGKATSDCTLGSQGWLATIVNAESPFWFGFAFDHLAASATSAG